MARQRPLQLCLDSIAKGLVKMAILMSAFDVSAEPLTHVSARSLLDHSKPTDWRPLDPENTLYVELPNGRIVIELAPKFALRTAANVKILVRQKYFDGLPIVRVQDNYVVQWGDPEGTRSMEAAIRTLKPEFERTASNLAFTALPDRDSYAPEAGFVDAFPVARDPRLNRAWLVHCYGMVGASRDSNPQSGNGADLYVVIGHAPRQLDRNITLVGRVVAGMELLAALPRGDGDLGFYRSKSEYRSIKSVRMAADVAEDERSNIEVLRTDAPVFAELIQVLRTRADGWSVISPGRVDVCNFPTLARPVTQN